MRRETLWEEYFRVLPPAPDDPERANSLGLSDAFVGPDEMRDEVERLERGELLLVGRVLRIDWIEGAEADRIRRRYFADSRYEPG